MALTRRVVLNKYYSVFILSYSPLVFHNLFGISAYLLHFLKSLPTLTALCFFSLLNLLCKKKSVGILLIL